VGPLFGLLNTYYRDQEFDNYFDRGLVAGNLLGFQSIGYRLLNIQENSSREKNFITIYEAARNTGFTESQLDQLTIVHALRNKEFPRYACGLSSERVNLCRMFVRKSMTLKRELLGLSVGYKKSDFAGIKGLYFRLD